MKFRPLTLEQAIKAYLDVMRLFQVRGVQEMFAIAAWTDSARYSVAQRNIKRMAQGLAPEFTMPRILGLDHEVHGVTFPFFVGEDFWGRGQYFSHPLDYSPGVNAVYCVALEHLGYTDKVIDYSVVTRESVKDCLWEIVPYDVVATEEARDAAFRKYLKRVSMNVNPHFFGEKSKRVQWRYLDYTSETMDYLKCHLYTADLEHRLKVSTKTLNQDNATFSTASLTAVPWIWTEEHKHGAVVAYDMLDAKSPKPICAMHITRCLGGYMTAGHIVASTDEQYKPYGLVMNAHLAAIRDVLLCTNRSTSSPRLIGLDLGTNFDDAGAYKERFNSQSIPWYNFPVVSRFIENEDGTFTPEWYVEESNAQALQ